MPVRGTGYGDAARGPNDRGRDDQEAGVVVPGSAGVTEQSTAERAEDAARTSGSLEWAVRIGLLAYGFVHLLIAWVAISLLSTHESGSATGQGALAQLAHGVAGRCVLAAMAVCFVALVVWQLIAGAVGYRDRSGVPRLLMRIGAAARAVTYGWFAWSCGRLAVEGASASRRSPESMTARVLAAPYGPLLLAVTGVVVAIIGLSLAVFGARKGFLSQLDDTARHADRRVPIVVLGQVGYVVKGLAFVVIGVLLVWAALWRDPQMSGGLDASLYTLLGHTAGQVAVVVTGIGIGSFGLFLLARSRHLELDTLTA